MLSEPSSNAVHVALIDLNDKRAKYLKNEFESIPYVELTHFQNWAAFETASKRKDSPRWRLVVIDCEVGSDVVTEYLLILNHWVNDLLIRSKLPNCQVVVLLYESNTKLKLRIFNGYQQRVSYWLLDDSEVNQPKLTDLVTQHIQRELRLTVKLDGDLRLEQQLQGIVPRGDLEIAKNYLATIAQRYMSNCGEIHVKSLTQGFSGALVVLARLTPWLVEANVDDPNAILGQAQLDENGQRQLVLKITDASEGRSVGRVLAHLPHITRLLKTDLQRSLPTLALTTDNQPVMLLNGRYVEAWEYLGGVHGKFRSFGQIYRHHESNDPSPSEAVGAIFKLLTESLHQDGVKTRQASLWLHGPAPYPETPPAPPYQLTGWWRAKILNAIDGLDRWAKKHEPNPLPDGQRAWDDVNRTIMNWINAGPNPNSIAATERAVLISAAHCDLNHHNVLWSDKLGRPFLIDFGTFHPEAHHLQDFAMFEAQLLFALMDSEDSSAHAAYDLTVTQLDVWLERLPVWIPAAGAMAKFNPIALRSSTKKKALCQGVKFAEELIIQVRIAAHHSYEQAVTVLSVPSHFEDEYCAALLYESLRMIAYENSLSLFKRILAAHVADRLIRRLNAPYDGGSSG